MQLRLRTQPKCPLQAKVAGITPPSSSVCITLQKGAGNHMSLSFLPSGGAEGSLIVVHME